MIEIDEKKFKSPQSKLVKFFKKSRDQWKEKTKKTKAQLKQFKNRIRFLETSKESLKNRLKKVEAELSLKVSQERAREEEWELLKKKKLTQERLH